MSRVCLCLAIAGLSLPGGCSKKVDDKPAAGNEEKAIRTRFQELQAAIKAGEADKIWALMDPKSRADAERRAKDIKTDHAKAADDEKKKLEDLLGLDVQGMAALSGPAFLKTKRFQKKYDELPDSDVEKVVVQGDTATLHFLEPDGDHEKMIFVRQDGEWKIWLGMPKVSLR